MCGICGAVNPGPKRVDEHHLRGMVAIQRHRGPDDARIASGGNVLLGHTRLSIIDLAGGAQPMSSHDGRFWIAFNGEIFNYIELRSALESEGCVFRTQSDTEVILESYRTWSSECFSRFNGQWALALWDRMRAEVVLSRDRAGIRPLYYTNVGESLLFASEVKALFCHPAVERRFDPSGIAQTFTFWCPVAPQTAYEGVHQLPPGTLMTVDTTTGKRQAAQYWSYDYGTDTKVRAASTDVNADTLRETLVDAARLRFSRSDVPVGAYLSGGLDSTITAAVLAEYTDAPLQTFSLAFNDGEFDESGYQDLVAKRLGTTHHRINVDAADIGEVFPEVVWYGEQPILRTAPAPLFMLSGLVREIGFKVVVTGEGADEMLAGYDIFREAAVRRQVAKNPDSADLQDLVLKLYPWMQRSPAQAPAFAKAFFAQAADLADPALSHRPRWRSSATLLRMLHPDFAVPDGESVASALIADLPSAYARWHPLEQAQYLESRTLLPGYILAPQGDRMLMGHSVEGRFPFLDHRVMELASSLPPEQKLNGLDEKHILKRAFADLIPTEVTARPKQPYRAPDASSFFSGGSTVDWLQEILAPQVVADAGIFAPAIVAGLLRKCETREGLGMSNTDNMRIVAVVSTMLLYNQMIVGRSAFDRAMREGESIPVTHIPQGAQSAGT